jgi:putative addiction module component (TIGR02574 family)
MPAVYRVLSYFKTGIRILFQQHFMRRLKCMKTLSRQEILRLSTAERMSLIGDLWDSLSDSDIALPATQARELQNRLDSFAVDQSSAISWEEFRSELARRAP